MPWIKGIPSSDFPLTLDVWAEIDKGYLLEVHQARNHETVVMVGFGRGGNAITIFSRKSIDEQAIKDARAYAERFMQEQPPTQGILISHPPQQFEIVDVKQPFPELTPMLAKYWQALDYWGHLGRRPPQKMWLGTIEMIASMQSAIEAKELRPIRTLPPTGETDAQATRS